MNALGQNKIDLKAFFDIENKQIRINQTIEYYNTSNDTLNTVYLNDWSNSYSTKTTPLAKRFTEEFSNRFHFANNDERGFTVITSLKDKRNDSELKFDRVPNQLDVIKVELNNPLAPNSSYIINITYIVQVPSDSFTRYGVTNALDFKLKYWYIIPAIYNGNWHYFSNKDLDDMYIPLSNLNFELEYPRNYLLTSELDVLKLTQNKINQVIKLYGENRTDTKLFLTRLPSFKEIETDFFTVVSNIEDEDLKAIDKAIITDNIAQFLHNHLGDYPYKKLLLTNVEYKRNPIYGLNQLPNFIRPFPDNFQYEIKLLKSALQNYLENTLHLNPRTDYWLTDGLQIYFMMKYVEENYPDMKLIGNLSKIWGIKSFHAADLKFNDQYAFMYMNMARSNIDQPLTMSKDSLLKFNKNIASKYKSGIGIKYLDAYINGNIVEETIKEFIANNLFKPTNKENFEDFLKSKTPKDINWFFKDYLTTSKKIDYKLKLVEQVNDSLKITIKNKSGKNVPIPLSLVKNDSVVSKIWLKNVSDQTTISIPKTDADKLVLNQSKLIPEINLRNNTKSLKPKLFNRPLQLRLFKDFEDPDYNQVFFMPIIEYNNIYDGLVLGLKAYNKTVLKKPLNYKISPQYGTNSNTLTGSTSVNYRHYTDGFKNLYRINFGLGASYSSYARNLFVSRLTPYFGLSFKDNSDFRANKRSSLSFRYVSIDKDDDVFNISENNEPNYNIFNARYSISNPGLVNYSNWFADFQLSKTFSKIAVNYEFRKLFQNNRQLNLRFYAGTFLNNKNEIGSDYFSFALDRPTDYLFDYNYLGRSEDSGIYSQQIIIAEGGFKSKLDTPFANQWMTTLNTSTSIWKYIHAYGDIGLVKNKYFSPKFVYDSGVRLILVEDYFEVYFPVYSNLGWEIADSNYSQKIRFIFTVDPKTLFGLFSRKWY